MEEANASTAVAAAAAAAAAAGVNVEQQLIVNDNQEMILTANIGGGVGVGVGVGVIEQQQSSASPSSAATPTSTNSGGTLNNATPAFSYDDLFPALPSSNSAPISNAATPACVRVSSSQKTHILRIPVEERKSTDSEKFGEGESKRICQQISKETSTQIEIVSAKDQSLTFLIKGKETSIVNARRKILLHFSTQGSKSVTIPKEHHRAFLGKYRERLHELERITATRINIPNQNDDSDIITIYGTRDCIEKAEQKIRLLSAEQCKNSSDRIIIPKVFHPFIMGPYNENLAKIAEETGAKVNVPPQFVPKDEIVIRGEKEAVAIAKAKVEAIYKEMEKKCFTVSVEVAKAQHRYVIGPKGSTIAEILRLTGVSVEMPPPDSPSETITLRGPQADLGNALTVVYQKANSVKSIEIDAPHWVHKYVIGRKGVNMKQLEEDCPNVNVNCLEDKIKLEGDPENVDKASDYLNNIIQNYQENYTFVVMTVNPAFYKHIIGKSGSNVNRLKDEFNVNINIEEREGQNNIRIEGPKDGVQKARQELQEKIDKLENEKTKDVIIDRRLHRQIIGAKGEKIREIKDRYRQVTIIIPTPQENTDIIKLRGPKEDVDKCHRDLMKLVKEIQETTQIIEVPIFKQFHKFVIGKGGANIKKIRDETQTKIDLPAEGDNNDVIIITGKEANVMEAKERILKIQNELTDIVTEKIQISPKYYNSIIGTGGKLIAAIMEECGGVSIKIPSSDSKSDLVTIRGPKDDVEKAKQQLLDLVNERQLVSFTAEVRVNYQDNKFLIGRNGASIRKIREATGVRFIFPGNDDADKEIITIVGREENVLEAKNQLEALISDIDLVVDDEIFILPKYHKHFLAKRGEILHRISDECGGVIISFPRSDMDSNRVTLKGVQEGIVAAKQRLMDIVLDLESYVTIDLVIPQRLHRNVLGARGSNVQQITMEHNVQIRFPDRDDTEPFEALTNGTTDITYAISSEEPVLCCDVIRITGRIENCNAAKQALIDLLPISEEFNLPYELHRTLIGPRRTNIRQFMSTHDVHVDVPPSEDKSNMIKVTGAPANVNSAKAELMRMIEEYQKDSADREARSFTLRIDVEPEYHPKIIGRRGAIVNKLRADHNVNIVLPNRDEENQRIITITGYQANAEAARDAILQIVGDLQDLVHEEIEIDSRIHSRLIGSRGRNIRKFISSYKVDIKFPSSEESPTNPDLVTIIGKAENVENAKEAILNIADDCLREYLENVVPPPPQSQTVAAFLPNSVHENGFVLKNAPWEKIHEKKQATAPNTQSQVDFPEFKTASLSSTAVGTTTPPITSAWGPRN